MRQKVAKRIKREIYGQAATSLESRTYTKNPDNGAFEANSLRRQYKQAKRDYLKG